MDKLPSKQKMGAILLGGFAAFSVFSIIGVLSFDDLAETTRKLCSRWGIFFSFVSALVGGCMLIWEVKARQNEDVARGLIDAHEQQIATIQMLESDLPLNFSIRLFELHELVSSLKADLKEAVTFRRNNLWLVYLTIGLLGIGSILLLVGEG